MDKTIVTTLGILLIAFIYWFFLMKKDEEIEASSGSVDIIVKGGYNPNTIAIPKGKKTKLNFIRQDPNTCLEEVVLSDFKVRRFLPMNQKITIELTPEKTGDFPFACGMNMFHGKIIVK